MTRQPPRRAASLSLGARLRGRGARRVPRTVAEISVRRIRWTLAICLLLVGLAAAKLVEIQVINAESYAESSVRQRARTVELPAVRGRIYDRDGDVLATSVDSATVYADPRAFRPSTTSDGESLPAAADTGAVAAELAPLLGTEAQVLVERLERDSHFVYLGRQLDWDVGEEVAARELPGIGVLTEPSRVYPAGPLAAQVLGFTGIDGEGLQGLESRYDDVLAGRAGMLGLERAPGGLEIASATRELSPPQPGTDLVLTLDRQIQEAAEHAAAGAMEEHDANGAGVVVLDVGTGDVLAMASTPGFDPNDRGQADGSAWTNRAVTDVFEPGSTQKALTMAAAIEEGLITAGSQVEVGDAVTVSGKTFRDVHPLGEDSASAAEILERSSNVGTIRVAQQLGEERLESYLRAFGYGATTGSGFPGESAGLLMPAESWWGTSLPTIAIGQGVAVSLLQLGQSYATIANDGVAVRPQLLRGSVGEDGRLTPATAASTQRVVSPDTAGQVRGMLEAAVHGDHATGARARVPGYRVAGKTGTARKPNEDARGYSSEYVATFVGFAPADDPRIVVAVMVDEPTPIYGGTVAAPLFAEVMSSALIARGVPAEDAGGDLSTALVTARRASSDPAEAARREEPGTDPADPASPPAGDPVGAGGP